MVVLEKVKLSSTDRLVDGPSFSTSIIAPPLPKPVPTRASFSAPTITTAPDIPGFGPSITVPLPPTASVYPGGRPQTTVPMPLTAWPGGRGPPKYPKHPEPLGTRRLTASGASAPDLHRPGYAHSPRGLLDQEAWEVPETRVSRSALRRVHSGLWDADEVRRVRQELRANLAETQRECLQRTGMHKAKMPEYRETYSKSLGKQHAERIAQGRTRERLTSEQEKALTSLFNQLGKQYDTADGLGKVDLNELTFATRALGYTEEYETRLLEEADRTGGQVQEGGRVKRDGKVRERARGSMHTHHPSLAHTSHLFPCTHRFTRPKSLPRAMARRD